MPICHNITIDGDDYHYADGDDNGYHYADGDDNDYYDNADGDDGYSHGADPLAAAVPVGGGVGRRRGGIR